MPSSSRGTRAAVVGSPGECASLPCQANISARGEKPRAIASDAGRMGFRCLHVNARCRSSSSTRERRKGKGGSRRSRCDTVQPESREHRPSRVHPRLPYISSLPLSLAKVLPSSRLALLSSCGGLALLAGQEGGGGIVAEGLASLSRVMYSCEHLSRARPDCACRCAT